MTHVVEVPAALAGERLDRVVAMVAGVSRAVAASLVDGGAVDVDGNVEQSVKRRVEEGAELRITLPPDDAPGVQPDERIAVAIVYADDDVVVVDKPAGLVVHPGAGNRANTLVNGLLARFPELADVGEPARPGIVHRLDKGTSGLLVVARTPEAYDSLVGQLSARTVGRTYAALVWGRPEPVVGVIDAPVGRSSRDRTRMTVSARGRDARTRYRVQSTSREPVVVSLVECQLETGRTHQVRVHLAAIGHPLVGDTQYRGAREGLRAPRPMLHARALAFTHPATGERIELESPLPADFEAVLAELSE